MENIQTLFEVQRAHRWTMSQSTSKERISMLLSLKKEIKARREDIAAALFADFKKPYAESELTEIHTTIDEINFAVKRLDQWMKPRRVRTPIALLGSSSFIRYEAKGVVLILAPWNYPFSLLINPLVAAIAAGNCAIARPSEKTPHTSKILKEIIDKVFSAKIAKVVIGEIDLAEKLLELPFDHIFFTGSTNVGKKVMAAAAKNLTTVTLELGGKSPVIIDHEVDLADCAEKLFWGKFMNGGQTCVAPDYVFIPEDLKEPFIDLFKKQIEKRFGENAKERLESQDFARMVDVSAYHRLAAKIQGEKKILPDTVVESDKYIPPTLLTDVSLDSPIMEDEIFGPILPILAYDKLDTVISYIRNHPKPLALYIFSKNKKMINKVLNATTSGGAAVNQVVLHLANPYLPFGGVGHSGMGSYHGEFGFKAFSHERAVLKQGRIALMNLYFPPYTTKLSKFAFRLLRSLE